MTTAPQRPYVFLLRWPGPPDPHTPEGWRASLEDARTGERLGFAYPEQLFAYLMQLAEGGRAPAVPPPPAPDP